MTAKTTRFFISLALAIFIASPKARGDVKWNHPQVKGSRNDSLLTLVLSGQTEPKASISTVSNVVTIQDPIDHSVRSFVLGKDRLQTTADTRGRFELMLRVPSGLISIPLRVEDSDGQVADHQLVYLVSFDQVIQALPEPPESRYRGVDFRIQIENSRLNLTTVSTEKHSFTGIGTTVQAHLYLLEYGSLRSSVFLSSRVISFQSYGLSNGDREGLQYKSVGPGVEASYGWLYLQSSYQFGLIDDYFVSSSAASKTIHFSGFNIGAGINYRLKRLGLGVGVTSYSIPLKTGAVADGVSSRFSDLTISANLIYYLGSPPLRFLRDLL